MTVCDSGFATFRPRYDVVTVPVVPSHLLTLAFNLKLANALVTAVDRQLLDVSEVPLFVLLREIRVLL